MNQLLKSLHRIQKLSPDLETLLGEVIQPFTFQKNEIIKEKGKICNYVYFIEQGLVRNSIIRKGEKMSCWFRKEGDFAFYFNNAHKPKCKADILEAVEDCIVWGISWEQMEIIYSKFCEFNFHMRIIFQYYTVDLRDKISTARMSLPSDRFNFVCQHEHYLLSRVPSPYLASYIDVTEEMLDKLRKSSHELPILNKSGKR